MTVAPVKVYPDPEVNTMVPTLKVLPAAALASAVEPVPLTVTAEPNTPLSTSVLPFTLVDWS